MIISQVLSSKNTAICMGGLLFSQNVLSAVNYLDLTLEQLLQINVTSASKKIETLADAPAAVYVITNEDIKRAGVTTIPDALRMAPGVEVARSDSNSWAISIRGFNSGLANKLLVLVDGRSIYNPVFGGVLWEAHNFLLEDIDRIEVIRGSGGALWGANAVNGIINITTKKAGETQGTLISALYGQEEQGTFSARHGGSFGEDNFYRAYVKAFKRDATRRLDGSDNYDEWDGFRTGFRTDWSDRFTLQGDVYRTNTQQQKINFSLIAPYAPVMDQVIVYRGVNVLGRWVEKGDDGSELSIQSYFNWAERDEPYNFIDKRNIYDIEMQYNFAKYGRHEWILGGGFRYVTDNETGTNNVTLTPKRRYNSLYNVFAQDKITLVPERWFLTLGSKFEHNEFSGYEVQPNLRLQWNPVEDQTLWSAVSRAVRTPTPIEQDFSSTILTVANGRAAFVPNQDYGSEKLTAYELGYRNQITSSMSIDLAGFYNDYQQLQTYTALPPSIVDNGVDPVHLFLPIMFSNDMKGTSHGAEASFSWAASENVKLTLNYSRMHMALTALDPTQEMAEQRHPTQQAGVKIFWNLNSAWALNTTANYVDNLPADDVDDYVRLDLNLSARLNQSLTFNIIGQNLLDGQHREFNPASDLNSGEIERSIFAKLTWKL